MSKIYKRFKKVATNYANRPIVKFKKDKKWFKYNYIEFLDIVDRLSFGFFDLNIKIGDRVAIFSENRWEWLASDLALNKINVISVPIHATSNKETIKYILKNSGSSYLLISKRLLEENKNFLLFIEEIKKIIVFNDSKKDLPENTLFFNDLIKKEKNNYDPFLEKENGIASIIYTSGTTGEPKGVILSDDNFLSNIDAVEKRVRIMPTDRFLSFLPLSHVLERTVGSYVPIMNGAMIAYAESIQKLSDNLLEIKPTILICVPRVLEKAYSKIFENIKKKNKRIKKIFYWALKKKNSKIKSFIADVLILRKIRKIVFGGKIRFVVSGGASLTENVLRFFKGINIKLVEGYGLTETSPIVSTNSLENPKIGTVGSPINGVKVKIDNDKEILVKGANVMKGYWQKKDLTREAFNGDGWFKTGDLGFLDADNFLTIIGRKKDIIITSNGKNIAPEKLESLLNLNKYIEQSLVVGHRKDFLSALIVPADILKDKNKKDYKKIKKEIEKEIEKINKDLPNHEQIKKIQILKRPFSIEAGELTPTLKLRRKILEAKYVHEIKKLYK